MQIQVDARPEEPLQLQAGGRADPLDHLSTASHHDRFLRLPVDHDRAIQPHQPALAGRLLELVDDDGAGKRDLVVRRLQELLPHDLGRKKPFRPVSDVVGRISRLPLRQPIDEQPFETIHVLSRRCRHGHDFGELSVLSVPLHDRQEARLLHQVDLIEDQDDRRLQVPHQVGDELVAFAGRLARIHHEADDVHFAHRFDGGVHHLHVHPVERTVNARRIDEHDLGVRVVAHAVNPRPRRLRLVGDDGELGADDPVEQRRLAGIRTADERDETGFHRDSSSMPPAGTWLRYIRTLLTRRRSASSTSTAIPSTSNRSPVTGTRPRCDSR